MKGLIGLLGTVLASGLMCTDADLKYVFSPCALNRTRGVFFYWAKDCEEGQLPSPLWNLSCDLPCPAGTFLGLSPQRNESGCESCPTDTFSPGGSDRVDFGGWIAGQRKFSSYCWKVMSDGVTTEEAQCSPWTADPTGDFLVSGRTNESAWIQTELSYFANLTTVGSLAIRYSKNSKQMGNFHNGMFQVLVNERVTLLDNAAHRQEWKEANIDLQSGPNEITLQFRKFNDKNHYNSGIKLAFFEVKGVFPSAHFCLPCTKGFSSEGANICQTCGENTYLDSQGPKHRCMPCPDTHYSEAGSIGAESCRLRRKCSPVDYASRLSPCREGFRTMDFYWKQPILCDVSTTKLPDPVISLACEMCNPGYFHKQIADTSLETECSACPSGSALNANFLNDTCNICPAGTYAPLAVNITHWIPFPVGFEVRTAPSVCSQLHSWTAFDSSSLTSNASTETSACSFTLERVVNVTWSGAVQFNVLFSKSAESSSWLSFEVNDQTFATFYESAPNSSIVNVHLDQGVSLLRWTHYQEVAFHSSAVLSSLLITGINEGGASHCQPCPSRHYSSIGSSRCEECAPGYTHTKDQLDCQRCPINMISGPLDCENCPYNTEANSDQTMCEGLDYLKWSNAEYNVSRLTGRTQPNICAASPRLSPLCQDNVYGPVAGDGSSFFLSVLNSANMSKSQYEKSENGLGYVWGLFPRETSLSRPKKECEADSILASLGSKIEEIEQTASGFTVKYSQGGLCPSSNLHFSSQIAFICDKSEGDGWPQFTAKRSCRYFFSWRTKLACRQCEETELEVITGRCEDNTRQIQYIEPDFCLYFPNSTGQIVETACNEAIDFASTWLALLGAVLLLLLLGTAVLLTCKLCNVQQRYQLLLRESEPRLEKDQ